MLNIWLVISRKAQKVSECKSARRPTFMQKLREFLQEIRVLISMEETVEYAEPLQQTRPSARFAGSPVGDFLSFGARPFDASRTRDSRQRCHHARAPGGQGECMGIRDRSTGLSGFEFLDPVLDRFLVETPVRTQLECWN